MDLNLHKPVTLFFILTITLFISAGCEGPSGPQGPPGPETIPTSFEFEADLLQENDFEFFSEIPGAIEEVFGSDVMLAYVLEDVEDDDTEVWRKLPITDFNDDGTRLLDFDFTVADIRVFLDADYPLGAADEFEGIRIRAVHVPAGLVSSNKMKEAQKAATVQELEVILDTEIKNIPLQ